MTYKICYWDSISNTQKERDATNEEVAEIETIKAAAQTLVPEIPQVVPMRSCRLILLQNNLLSVVQNYIDNIPGLGGDSARINWEYAQTVRRDDPLVVQLIPSLGKTEAEIDQMFIDASLL